MKNFQDYLNETGEIGFVEAVNSTVITVSGIPFAKPQEIVILETGDTGFVLSLHKDYCDVLLYSQNTIKPGTKVARTKEVLAIPLGNHLLGSTIDPFGKPLDPLVHFPDLKDIQSEPIDIRPPGIGARKRISNTFETGVALVDLILPLGKGQRELIIGDRKTGKTNFLLQVMLTQAKQGTVCIYVAIGKKQQAIRKTEEFLKNHNILNTCVVVGTSANDSPGVIYVTPYTGMKIAEYFCSQGKNALVIFDDLTTHARYYRQISLLIKRFPGRNSYPADIFYAHARLLERAGNFIAKDNEERSITCLPVVETVQGDLTGYIQTNVMSITDGHLYFDIDLFTRGRRPPVHPFLSVTRIGRQTQTALRQTLNREILSFLSMYDKMQNFTHFGAEVSQNVASVLATGNKIVAFFDQLSSDVIPLNLQIFLFSLLWVDVWREKDVAIMKTDMERIISLYNSDQSLQKEVQDMIDASDSFNMLLAGIRGKPDEFYKKLGL